MGDPVPSLDYHYLQRRFVDGEPFRSKAAYQAWASGLLHSEGARIYKQVSKRNERFVVYREKDRWLTIVDAQSHRYISAFRLHQNADPDDLGEYLWPLNELTK